MRIAKNILSKFKIFFLTIFLLIVFGVTFSNKALAALCAIMESDFVSRSITDMSCSFDKSPSNNHTPQISGVNITQNKIGQPYSFYLQVSDQDGDRLSINPFITKCSLDLTCPSATSSCANKYSMEVGWSGDISSSMTSASNQYRVDLGSVISGSLGSKCFVSVVVADINGASTTGSYYVISKNKAMCGDLGIDSPNDLGIYETCDGNATGGGWSCFGTTTPPVCNSSCNGRICLNNNLAYQGICGNGIKESIEACDKSDGLSGWTCSSGAMVGCNATCSARVCSNNSVAYKGACGNGKIDSSEVCDINGGLGLSGWACPGGAIIACNDDCYSRICMSTSTPSAKIPSLAPYSGKCGNGIKEAGESCDKLDGLSGSCTGGGALSCNASCGGFICSSGDWYSGVCGDGIKQDEEVCDGNENLTSTNPKCTASDVLTCNSICSQVECSQKINDYDPSMIGEQVSDNNDTQVVERAVFESATDGVSCGNKILEDSEQCDGEAYNGSWSCKIGDFSCGRDCRVYCNDGSDPVNSNKDSDAEKWECGNGKQEKFEQCDDGVNNRDFSNVNDIPEPGYDTEISYCTKECKIKIVPKISNMVSVGASSTCAISKNNTLYCWGANGSGQLGNRTTVSTTIATTAVFGGKEFNAFKNVSVGFNHVCAIDLGGALYCWGNNNNYKLGFNDGYIGSVATPVKIFVVGENLNFKEVSVGDRYGCAIDVNHNLYCWGRNNYGQLGLGYASTTAIGVLPKYRVNGLYDSISVGESHACAVEASADTQRVSCWGNNDHGQLGNGSTASSTVPIFINWPASLKFKSVSVGKNFSCALTASNNSLEDNKGKIYCWGTNLNNQIAMPEIKDYYNPERLNPTGNARTQFKSLEVGDYYGCAVASSTGRNLFCWGVNSSGQLGVGNKVNSQYATSTIGLNYREVYSGNNSVCAKDVNSSLYCWGSNSGGQLGFSTTTLSTTTPTYVNGVK